jgi:hypothetical protein
VNEDRYRPMLGDLVEGSLSASERREVEAHVKSCEDCRGTLAELTEIRAAASALGRLEPPPGVWERVRDSIRSQSGETPGGSVQLSKGARLPFIWSHRWALAATLLFVVGTLVTIDSLGLFPNAAPPEGSPEWVSAELQLAESHYQNAIRGLEKIVDEGQGTLDPQVAVVLRQNLTVIEDAIAESREAAREEPANPAAGESLLAALRQKVSLLQNTVLLINEIRKGQGEGAVNILNEMRDSESANDESPS